MGDREKDKEKAVRSHWGREGQGLGASKKERQAGKDTDPERQGEGETKQNLILCLRKLSFSQCSFFSRALARIKKKQTKIKSRVYGEVILRLKLCSSLKLPSLHKTIQ